MILGAFLTEFARCPFDLNMLIFHRKWFVSVQLQIENLLLLHFHDEVRGVRFPLL